MMLQISFIIKQKKTILVTFTKTVSTINTIIKYETRLRFFLINRVHYVKKKTLIRFSAVKIISHVTT